MEDIRIIVCVPPPPYRGEVLPPAPPVDRSTPSSLILRGEGD